MCSSGEAQFDSPMYQTLLLHPCACTCVVQEISGPLLEDTSPDSLFDMSPSSHFKNDRLDSMQVKQVRQHQTSWPGTNNSDLSSHRLPCHFFFSSRRLTAVLSTNNCGTNHKNALKTRMRPPY